MKGELEHEEGLRGDLVIQFQNVSRQREALDGSSEVLSPFHGVRVRGEGKGMIEWGFSSDSVKVTSPSGETKIYQTEGDGWVSGGVREALGDCLRECALWIGLLTKGHGVVVPLCAPEEGLRDASVVWALCRSKEGEFVFVQPPELENIAVEQLYQEVDDRIVTREKDTVAGRSVHKEIAQGQEDLTRPRHYGMLQERDDPAGRCIPNAVGTRWHAPWRVVRCFCVRDVRAAMIRYMGIHRRDPPRAIGADHSWSACGESTGVRLDMRRMSRVLDVRWLTAGEKVEGTAAAHGTFWSHENLSTFVGKFLNCGLHSNTE